MSELTTEEIDIITNVMPEANAVPDNAPPLKQLESWQNRIGKWHVKIAPDGKQLKPGIYFEPTNLFPNHDVPKNRVNYRYHVRVHLGWEKNNKGQIMNGSDNLPAVVKLARRPADDSPLDFHCDVDKFLKEYKAA